MYWLTEYPVDKVSFFMAKYLIRNSPPPLEILRGGNKMFSLNTERKILKISTSIKSPQEIRSLYIKVYMYSVSYVNISWCNFLWSEYFKDYFCENGSHAGCDIRIVFTFPPNDSTLQYKKCVHLWNNFPCIRTLSRSKQRELKTKHCSNIVSKIFLLGQ